MESIKVVQGKKDVNIQITKKTVEWIVQNTEVYTFDPISFSGYQRKINDNHCKKIVEYLKKSDFYLPTSIVCVKIKNSKKLRIVDGQHRVQAFKEIQKTELDLYDKIKRYDMAITLLDGISFEDEIETFITINKTSKKVDTSLALVLKSKIYNKDEDNSLTAKSNYLSVELAFKLNSTEKDNNIWFENISFEGFNKSMHKYISLNSFVKAIRKVILALSEKEIIDLNWKEEKDINKIVCDLYDMFNSIYDVNKLKWKQLYAINDLNVLCGSIGVSVFMKLLASIIKENNKIKTIDDAIKEYSKVLRKSNIEYSSWMSGETFSKFSSESGYAYIVEQIKIHSI